MKNDLPASAEIELGNGADIAFLLVVLSAYFSIFSALEEITILQLVAMILAGVLYLMLGIYGFSLLRRYDHLILYIAYFSLEILIGTGILLLGTVGGKNLTLVALLFLPLVVQSVLVLHKYWMLFINVLILVAYTTVIFAVNRDGSATSLSFPLFFTAQIFIVFFTQMAVSESRSREEVERLVTELAEANEHLRSYALKVEELAVTQERNRMAREIHDGLGHYLTSIHIHLQAAAAVLANSGGSEVALSGIKKAQNLAKNALDDVRQSVSTLRSPLVGHLPLSVMIQDHIQHTATGPIDVLFEMAGEEKELPPNISWTILRATQEAMNNAVKHAHCTHIQIILSYHDDKVHLLIVDDGIGSEDPTGGYGLLGLQERIHLLNGNLMIRTAKQEGFQVEIGVPLR
jgi:signal transduction histidine kinase